KWRSEKFNHIIRMCMSKCRFSDTVKFYIDSIKLLYAGDYEIIDFSFSKKISRVDYSPGSAQWYLIKGLAERGNDLQQMVSNRYDFIIVADNFESSKSISSRTYLLEEAISMNLDIDFLNDMNKLEVQLDRFVSVIYKDDILKDLDIMKNHIIESAADKIYDVLQHEMRLNKIVRILKRDYGKGKAKDRYLDLYVVKGKKKMINDILVSKLNKRMRYIDEDIIKMINGLYESYFDKNRDSKSRKISKYMVKLFESSINEIEKYE